MKKHRGYRTSKTLGAQCSNCEGWIPEGNEAALVLPGKIDENGSVDTNAKAIHGVLCEDCLEGA